MTRQSFKLKKYHPFLHSENLIPFIPAEHPRAGLRLGFKTAQITIPAIRGELQLTFSQFL